MAECHSHSLLLNLCTAESVSGIGGPALSNYLREPPKAAKVTLELELSESHDTQLVNDGWSVLTPAQFDLLEFREDGKCFSFFVDEDGG